MDGLDLNHLTHAERECILAVLRRDQALRDAEHERVVKLKAEIRSSRLKGAMKDTHNIANQCARCREQFGWLLNRGAVCLQCRRLVCKKCRQYIVKSKWLCVFCFQQMELEAQTGHWFYSKFPKSKRDKLNEVISAGTIVQTSLRLAKSSSSSDPTKPSQSSEFGDGCSDSPNTTLLGTIRSTSSISSTLSTSSHSILTLDSCPVLEINAPIDALAVRLHSDNYCNLAESTVSNGFVKSSVPVYTCDTNVPDTVDNSGNDAVMSKVHQLLVKYGHSNQEMYYKSSFLQAVSDSMTCNGELHTCEESPRIKTESDRSEFGGISQVSSENMMLSDELDDPLDGLSDVSGIETESGSGDMEWDCEDSFEDPQRSHTKRQHHASDMPENLKSLNYSTNSYNESSSSDCGRDSMDKETNIDSLSVISEHTEPDSLDDVDEYL